MEKQTKKLVSGKKLSKAKRFALGVVLIVVVLIGAAVFVEPWLLERRQETSIRGLAEDYPQLVAGLEEAIDEQLTIESSCFTTQEKFSGGVSSCQLLTAGSNLSEEQTNKAKNFLGNNPAGFNTGDPFSNNIGGYTIFLGDSKKCVARYEGILRIDCRAGYSTQKTADLISELLNAERLNQVKDSL